LGANSREDGVAVTGIGGVFFRAKHPDALTKWYRTHFAVTMEG
jgi:hypothetical protein